VALIGQAVGRRVRIVRIPRPLAHAALTVTAAAARVTNRATLLHPDKANEFFQQAWVCDPGPLTEATGWRAVIDLERGTRATADWYRERKWL
jgi:nucleoside-diphosphate-sugar epimerase